MDVLTPVLSGALLALFTAIQVWISKGRFDRIERDAAAFRREMRDEFAAVRAEMRGDFAAVRAEIRQDTAWVRADLTAVALAVGAGPRPQTG